MKIMYVNTLGVWGGVATYLKPLIVSQVKDGNDVTLVVGNEGALTDYIRKQLPQVKIIILKTMKRDVDVKGILKSIPAFHKILKKENPDIIHINCIMAGIIARLGSIFSGKKIIYNAHGWAFEPGTDKKFKWPAIIIEKCLALFTDKIICVSEYEKKIANKYHIFKNNNQAVVIKNGSADFIKLSNDFNKENDEFVLTMAARFWKQKNQLLLLKAFNYFINEYSYNKKIKLYLLGDGPLLNECKVYVKKHRLNDYVSFTGQVNNVNEYYAISDVVVLITNYDAIAISLIEALSMAKPIIASDVSGVPENFSNHINGFCVKNDEKDIAESINKMISNDDLRRKMSNNSRKLYERDFTLSKNVNAHSRLYANLINKNSGDQN